MAATPFPVCWPNTRRTAAIAVAAAPVASILRLIRSIVGVLLDDCCGRCGSRLGHSAINSGQFVAQQPSSQDRTSHTEWWGRIPAISWAANEKQAGENNHRVDCYKIAQPNDTTSKESP